MLNASPLLQAITPQGASAAVSATATPLGTPANTGPLPATLPTVNSGLLDGGSLNGWTCKQDADPNAYDACDAAKAGQCRALPCAQLAKAGYCDSPLLRVTDWAGRSVTQRCAANCPCRAAPALRQTLAPTPPDWCCGFQAAEYFVGDDGRTTTGLAS